jgi:hypothetical protein
MLNQTLTESRSRRIRLSCAMIGSIVRRAGAVLKNLRETDAATIAEYQQSYAAVAGNGYACPICIEGELVDSKPGVVVKDAYSIPRTPVHCSNPQCLYEGSRALPIVELKNGPTIVQDAITRFLGLGQQRILG